ncbi:hypothetical protein B5X24_HaOG208617 [Helicoverpa armigera]|nr:hypothetical protein B5X24_HaOG208617 [Helicoverpa armigera]
MWRGAVARPISHHQSSSPPIVSSAVACFTISASTVTPAIKLQQWKCRMRLKDDDATTPDHCDECNNGILQTKVATIDGRKAELSDATCLRYDTPQIQTILT